MNDTLEIKMLASRRMAMSPQEEDLMQQHLRDENLPEAVMPACPINKVLKGQKALVTGANSGIGQAVALALAHAGSDVVVNYVSRPDAAEAVVKEAMRCSAKRLCSQGQRRERGRSAGDVQEDDPRVRHHRHPRQQRRSPEGRAHRSDDARRLAVRAHPPGH